MESTFIQRLCFSPFLLQKRIPTRIAYLGIFVALSIVANVFSIDLSPTQKISFTYLVAFFSGTFFGPLGGFAVCFLGDWLGFLINTGGGFYWFLTGLCSGLFAFIPGVIMNFLPIRCKGAQYIKAVVSMLLMYALITCGLGAYSNYLYVKYIYSMRGDVFEKTFGVYLAGKIVFQTLVSLGNYALCISLIPTLNAIKPLKIKIE